MLAKCQNATLTLFIEENIFCQNISHNMNGLASLRIETSAFAEVLISLKSDPVYY